MTKYLFLLLIIASLNYSYSFSQNISVDTGKILNAQKFDKETYLHLLNADTAEFAKFASKIGFETHFDFNANRYYAQTKKITISKILPGRGFPKDGSVLVVNSFDKKDIDIVLGNARQVVNKKDTLVDKKYVYIKSEDFSEKNILTYRVDVYKLKQWRSFYKIDLWGSH